MLCLGWIPISLKYINRTWVGHVLLNSTAQMFLFLSINSTQYLHVTQTYRQMNGWQKSTCQIRCNIKPQIQRASTLSTHSRRTYRPWQRSNSGWIGDLDLDQVWCLRFWVAEFNGRLGQWLGRSSEQQQRRQREQRVVGERAGPAASDREREQDNEEGVASERKDLEGREGDCAGVRVGVHQLRHRRGVGQVSEREEEDDQRWRSLVGHDDAGVRGVRGAVEGVPPEVPGGGGREDRCGQTGREGRRRLQRGRR